MYKRMQA